MYAHNNNNNNNYNKINGQHSVALIKRNVPESLNK